MLFCLEAIPQADEACIGVEQVAADKELRHEAVLNALAELVKIAFNSLKCF